MARSKLCCSDFTVVCHFSMFILDTAVLIMYVLSADIIFCLLCCISFSAIVFCSNSFCKSRLLLRFWYILQYVSPHTHARSYSMGLKLLYKGCLSTCPVALSLYLHHHALYMFSCFPVLQIRGGSNDPQLKTHLDDR